MGTQKLTRKQMETTELCLDVMNLASCKTILTYRFSTWIPPNLSKALRTRDLRSLRVDSWSLSRIKYGDLVCGKLERMFMLKVGLHV